MMCPNEDIYIRNTIYYMYEHNILAPSKNEKGFDLVRIIKLANENYKIDFDVKLKIAFKVKEILDVICKGD
jgi:hypothetical protein